MTANLVLKSLLTVYLQLHYRRLSDVILFKLSYYLPMDTQYERTMNRLRTCAFTVRTALAELEDPESTEMRADLYLASEELLNEVHLLNRTLSEVLWSSLDKQSHPSQTQQDN